MLTVKQLAAYISSLYALGGRDALRATIPEHIITEFQATKGRGWAQAKRFRVIRTNSGDDVDKAAWREDKLRYEIELMARLLHKHRIQIGE